MPVFVGLTTRTRAAAVLQLEPRQKLRTQDKPPEQGFYSTS